MPTYELPKNTQQVDKGVCYTGLSLHALFIKNHISVEA
jgi:hypothetical protein